MRRSRTLLVVFLALASLVLVVSALAFQQARVTSQVQLAITSTQAAALGFVAPTAPDPNLTVNTAGTSMAIGFKTGVQANSSYVFSPAFGIKNNDAAPIDVTITPVTQGDVTFEVLPVTGQSFTNVAPGGTVDCNIRVSVGPNAAIGTVNIPLVVDAVRR